MISILERWRELDEIIDHPDDVRLLHTIYTENGPGNLKWDFSVPGQVTSSNGTLRANNGRLVGIYMSFEDIGGILRIHGFPSLLLLTASSSNLKAVELSGTNNLERLELNGCNISDIKPLLPQPNIKRLHLCENRIRDLLPLADCRELRGLGIARNPISDIAPLANFAQLEYLYLHDTEVRDLAPLAGCSRLWKLLLDNNKSLKDLRALASLTALEYLDICGCELTDEACAPLASLSALKGLRIANNHLLSGRFLGEKAILRELDMSGNLIHDLSFVSSLRNLEHLGLVDNRISDLASLAEVSSLRTLDLSGNPLRDIAPLAGLSNLENLSLERTEVTDLSPLANLQSLQRLCIEKTPVRDISVVQNMSALEILDLDYDHLQNEEQRAILDSLGWLHRIPVDWADDLHKYSPTRDGHQPIRLRKNVPMVHSFRFSDHEED